MHTYIAFTLSLQFHDGNKKGYLESRTPVKRRCSAFSRRQRSERCHILWCSHTLCDIFTHSVIFTHILWYSHIFCHSHPHFVVFTHILWHSNTLYDIQTHLVMSTHVLRYSYTFCDLYTHSMILKPIWWYSHTFCDTHAQSVMFTHIFGRHILWYRVAKTHRMPYLVDHFPQISHWL